MNISQQSLCPEVCERLEVYCDSCVGLRARSLARICPGLSNAQVSGLFSTLYPSHGCAPMHQAFSAVYIEAIGDQFELSAPGGILSVA
jgi:hypothetical protein